MNRDERHLADLLRPDDAPLRLRQGVVATVNADGTVDVTLGGSSVVIDDVVAVGPCTSGQTVWILQQHRDLLALGTPATTLSGSDANGTWNQSAGLLVCRHTLLVNGTGTTTWTYPKAFSGQPQVVASPLTGASRFVTVATRGTSSASFALYTDAGGAPPNTNVMCIAIGAP